jgi:hypothetical protein
MSCVRGTPGPLFELPEGAFTDARRMGGFVNVPVTRVLGNLSMI